MIEVTKAFFVWIVIYLFVNLFMVHIGDEIFFTVVFLLALFYTVIQYKRYRYFKAMKERNQKILEAARQEFELGQKLEESMRLKAQKWRRVIGWGLDYLDGNRAVVVYEDYLQNFGITTVKLDDMSRLPIGIPSLLYVRFPGMRYEVHKNENGDFEIRVVHEHNRCTFAYCFLNLRDGNKNPPNSDSEGVFLLG